MSDLILPDRRIETEELLYPGRKPVGDVKIDWGHIAAKNLIRCLLFKDDLSVIDLVTGQKLQHITPNPAVNITPKGSGLRYGVDIGTTVDYIIIPLRSETHQSYSVSWAGYVHGAAPARILMRDKTSIEGHVLFWNNNNTFDMRIGGANTINAGIWENDTYKSICITSSIYSGNMFVGGKNILTSAASSSPINTYWLLHANGLATDGGADATDLILNIWDAPLKAELALSITKNPYQFLIPA